MKIIHNNPFIGRSDGGIRRMEEDLAYWNGLDIIEKLRDKEIKQLVGFANGITTVNELPSTLATLGRWILKHRELTATALMIAIKHESEKRSL